MPVTCDDPATIACLTFDTATFADSSPLHNTPVLAAASPPPIMPLPGPGISGLALSFAGFPNGNSLGYASFLDASAWIFPAMPAATVEMWIYPSILPEPGKRMGLLDANGGFSVFLYANKMDDPMMQANVIRCGSNDDAWSNTSIPANTWTHVACVFSTVQDKTRNEIYINGVLDSTLDSKAGAPFHPGTGAIFLGANATQGNDAYNGFIDEFRVWNIARTGAEICAAMGGSNCP